MQKHVEIQRDVLDAVRDKLMTALDTIAEMSRHGDQAQVAIAAASDAELRRWREPLRGVQDVRLDAFRDVYELVEQEHRRRLQTPAS